ncbi:uncharacterized protein G2W53_042140 [Senna tora]|uniref:Uncharacterized protein n=1 Tax=Senna tora TaxID=362788 RepID=A0A834W3I6_9FABA|nr:uncharacterized protein G2W53_042140 [Senna tora]
MDDMEENGRVSSWCPKAEEEKLAGPN